VLTTSGTYPGVTNITEPANPSGAPDFTPGFSGVHFQPILNFLHGVLSLIVYHLIVCISLLYGF
jgi:hypothetical protein